MADTHDKDMSETTQSRDALRESIFFSAVVRFDGPGRSLSVRVRNISAGGMMIDCGLNAKIGDVVTADIKNIGEVRGKVAWCVAPRMGIAFDYEIDPKLARLRVENGVAGQSYKQPVISNAKAALFPR
jgi:PilZ domain